MDVKQVIEERNEEYADAWALEGIVCNILEIKNGLFRILTSRSFMFFPWVMILNKLLRILGSPDNPDHWLDIQGYAKLVHDKIIPTLGDSNDISGE